MSTGLVNIVEYDEYREKIAIVKDTCNFIPDVASDEGYEKSKRVALDVGKVLTSLEKKRKELKSESLAFGRKVDEEAKSIAGELESFQIPHKDAYKQLDNARRERETARKAELEERTLVIRGLPESMRDSDSAGIKMAMESLATEECLDFYEYTEQALKARNASRLELARMFSEKLNQEKEATELAVLRKKQAEQDQKDHDEAIAKEAAHKAEQETIKAKQAEQDAINKAAEAVKQREEIERQAKFEAEQSEARRAEAEKNAALQAGRAAEQARQAQIKLQAEKETAEKVAIEKREANKRHVSSIRKAAKESIMKLDINEPTAKKIVLAINAGEIINVSINY